MKKKSVDNFKSVIFKQMFFSYIIIITMNFIAYSAVSVRGTVKLNKNQMMQQYNLKLDEITNAVDMQLLGAKNIVASINNSKDINKVYLHTLSREKTIDSYTLYRSLNQIQEVKEANNSGNVYEVMVFFDGYDCVYTGSNIMKLTKKLDRSNVLKQGLTKATVNSILGMDNHEIIFNKDFLIYLDVYSYSTNMVKGMVFVLYDTNAINNIIQGRLEEGVGFKVYYEDECIAQSEVHNGLSIKHQSIINENLTYEIIIPSSKFNVGYKPFVSITLIMGLFISILYIILAFLFTSKYYNPIAHIMTMIGRGEKEGQSLEMKEVVEGIMHLIGERNGYREKIVTITPYAKQGMLQGIINGNIDSDKVKVLCDENYVNLKKLYFIIGVVNVVGIKKDKASKKEAWPYIRHSINELCQKYTTEETIITSYIQDSNNTYLIINGNNCENLEDLLYIFYEGLSEDLGKEDYVVTIGADEIKKSINDLSEACSHASKALGGMITGGRGAVYFYETDIKEKGTDYYFPKEASKRLIRAVKNRNLSEVKLFLEELYCKNIEERETSVATIMILVDELHMCILKSIKELGSFESCKGQDTINRINVEKFEMVAPLDEILAYYYKVLEMVCNSLPHPARNSKKEANAVEQRIIAYINDNYMRSDMSLGHMTEKFKVSNKYISATCKNAFGMSYLQYVQDKRIKEAAILIKSSDETLERIAEKCGYTNILTFRRNFKAIMGITPSDYRIEP